MTNDATQPVVEFLERFTSALGVSTTTTVEYTPDGPRINIGGDEAEILLRLHTSDATRPKVLPPHRREKRLVFKNIDRAGWSNDIECYLKDGGYEELKKALRA